MSIRARLLLLVLFATLIPALVGAVLFLDYRNAQISDARRNLAASTRLIALGLTNTVRGTAQLEYGLARARELDTRDRAACSSFLADVLKEFPHYTGILTIKPNGELFCDSLRTNRTLNLNDRQYFQRALNGQSPLALEAAFGRLTGIAVLQVAHGVRKTKGVTKFILLASINLEKYMQLRAKNLPQKNAIVALADASGKILSWIPHGENIAGSSIVNTPLFRFAQENKGDEIREIVGTKGTNRIWATSTLPELAESGLHILVGVSKNDLLAEADASLTKALVTLSVVWLLVFASAWALTELGIRRQVSRIISAVNKLGGGDINARTGLPHTRDEFGQLAHNLDNMADALQKRQSEAVRAEARFTNIVNLAADAIISIDEEQRIIAFNYGAEKIFGYTSAEMLGQPLEILLPERFSATHRKHVHQFGEAAEVARHMNRRPDILGRRKDGNEFFAEASISRAKEDRKMVFTVFLRDISDRKEAEEQIHQLNINLEKRVVERTAELAAANQELESFSYSVSHDLRTPLRAIDGFSQVLVEDFANKIDDQAMSYLGRIRAASQRMGLLIDDMLALSRVTRTEMLPKNVNLSLLADNLLADLKKSAPDRNVHLSIEPGLTCMGDLRLLNMVLDNLLSNAWKFTAHVTQPRIEFGANLNANGEKEFFVRDNGAGFDMAYADKLFGPFQRLHSATEFPGTGVGLAIVKRVILRHGGSIRGESSVDQGATFFFTLTD